MMRLLLPLLALVCLAGAARGAEKPEPWFVQLVRGTDQGRPPEKAWKRIGPKLGGSLARVLKWQHYYEVKCEQVAVTPGQTATVRLDSERELKIHFTSAHDAELRLYRKGKLTRKDVAHLKNRMAILGGDEKDEGWFVVVRRDKPTTE